MYTKWQKSSLPLLKGLGKGSKPKALIETVSENLLEAFRHAPLLDAYDVYQRLMDYWGEIMQDDAYLIGGDGWIEAGRPRQIVEEKGKRSKEKPDFTLGKVKFKAELIPPALVIARYFAAEQGEIDKLEMEVAALTQDMEEMAEEHGGDEGLLAAAKTDKDKITKASVVARLKAIKNDPDAGDERKLLTEYLALAEKESQASEKLGQAQEALTKAVAAKYGKLSEDDIKTLVVEDKWLSTVAAVIQRELDRVSQTLTGRIQQLADRYVTPLPKLAADVDELSARVQGHLRRMGAVWG
jgi:type I restriction enzyme M protein